ncbi:GntR family transcriptional regulator [Pseudomonas chlororaphis]|uniref:GntR family transcriptional regulator n=1 Tax=Pseudomonas chlororaphis TaxID=587753 RepID=UPI002407F28C|nr:GntR family transcriptional regulator [Pseudomonas chlororaphis]
MRKVRPRAADVVQNVHAAIQQKLSQYEIRPAERINEVELSASLGVSRTPLREALNRLATEGLVSFVPNRGFYARNLEIAEIINLFEFRAGVEGIAIQAACARATDEDIENLEQQWGAVSQQVGRLTAEEITAADEEFHMQLVSLARNPELSKCLANVNVRIRFVRQCAIEHPASREDTISEHAGIIAALRARDAKKARELIESHVKLTAEDALGFISKGLARIYLK